MAAEKTPVLLVLSIRTQQQQWFLSEITLSGDVTPLLRSEPGNLQDYVGQPFDDQVSFLRHRLAGALQCGCDRLWGRTCKASHILVVIDGEFEDSAPELNQAIADHFHLWMTRPAVTFVQFPSLDSAPSLCAGQELAGHLEADQRPVYEQALPSVVDAMHTPGGWEVVAQPKTS